MDDILSVREIADELDVGLEQVRYVLDRVLCVPHVRRVWRLKLYPRSVVDSVRVELERIRSGKRSPRRSTEGHDVDAA